MVLKVCGWIILHQRPRFPIRYESSHQFQIAKRQYRGRIQLHPWRTLPSQSSSASLLTYLASTVPEGLRPEPPRTTRQARCFRPGLNPYRLQGGHNTRREGGRGGEQGTSGSGWPT